MKILTHFLCSRFVDKSTYLNFSFSVFPQYSLITSVWRNNQVNEGTPYVIMNRVLPSNFFQPLQGQGLFGSPILLWVVVRFESVDISATKYVTFDQLQIIFEIWSSNNALKAFTLESCWACFCVKWITQTLMALFSPETQKL